jgi:hypothetical protein
LRYPLIGDLARSARYRWFDAPVVEAAREQAYAAVRAQLGYLHAHPEAADYEERIEALVASPEPLARFLAERISGGVPRTEPLLEVLARRHYREHTLDDVRAHELGGGPFVTARYTLDGRPTYLVSTLATRTDLARAAEAVQSAVDGAPAGHETVVDLYLSWPGAARRAEVAAAELESVVAGLPFARKVRRIAVSLSGTNGSPLHAFTYRPDTSGPGVVEDDLVRGLHPMVGRRLDLWRLRDFRITRLPAPDDVLLYRCAARTTSPTSGWWHWRRCAS